MRTSRFVLLMFVAGGASGCAAIRAETVFSDVEQLVGARSPGEIRWYGGTEAARQVEERIASLLANELTPETAVQIALLNNRALQVTFEGLGIAQAEVVQAGLLPNPIVHLGLRLPVNAAGTSAELSVAQDFIRALQIPLRKRIATAELEAIKREVAQAVLDLSADVKVAFYSVQGAEQMLEVRRSVTESTEYSAEFARRQREAGNITELDLQNDIALFEQARLDLARAEEDVLARREELNALLGLWGTDTRWTVAARLPDAPAAELPLKGLESLAISQRLDLAAARQEIERQAQAVGLARFEAIIPVGEIGADAEREPEGEWTLGPAITFPLPIFDLGQAASARARAQLRQAQGRYWALAVQIRTAVRRSHTKVEAARRRSNHYKKVMLPVRGRVVHQTQLQYNAMQVGPFQLLQAKRDEIEAGQGYVESLTDYWVARAELERAVGGQLGMSPSSPTAEAQPTPPAAAPMQEQQGDPHHH